MNKKVSPPSPKALLISLVLLFFSLSQAAFAQGAGDPDPTFGTSGDGRMIVDIGDHFEDRPMAVALQPDGKILVTGWTIAPGGPSYANFATVRFNVDGSIDTSFGVNGRTLTDFRESGDYPSAITVQPDGKILVAGFTYAPNGDFNFALVRYDANGIIDTTFGDNAFGPGRVITDILNGSSDEARGMVLQPDGKIILVGTTNAPGPDQNVAMVRYNSNGIIDTSFGNNPSWPGRVITTLPSNARDLGSAVALQSDGKIVVAGITNAPVANGDDNFLTLRYSADGVLDTSFGVNGGTVADMRGKKADLAYSLAIQPDGKIVVTGYTEAPNGEGNFATIRYTAKGVPDDPFGGSKLNPGRTLTDFGNGSAESAPVEVALDPVGQIVVAGTTFVHSNDFGVVRYNKSGIPITGFGADNRVRTNIGHTPDGAESDDLVDAVAVQPDGKIIVVGETTAPNGDYNFALVRYLDPDLFTPWKITLSKTLHKRTKRMNVYYLDGYVRNHSALGLPNETITLNCRTGSQKFTGTTLSSADPARQGSFRFQVNLTSRGYSDCRVEDQGVKSKVVRITR